MIELRTSIVDARRGLRWLFAFALCTIAPVSSAAPPAASKPNVVIVLIDDLGCTDVGVDGSSFYETPHLDALARSGVRFTQFYSACPVCSPTRAALMTGKVPQRVRITDWIHPSSGVALPSTETTLAEALGRHGYQTAYVGKWHLGETDADLPTEHGFEWMRGVNRGGQPASYYFPFHRPGDQARILNVPDLEGGKEGDYLTDALTTAAISFLEGRDPQRPFLLCLGHYAIHTPIQPPANLPAKYRDKRAAQFGDSATPTVPVPFDAVSRARQDDADYAAMMENLDHNIGRLLGALDERGLRENTIVVFTSDNGGLCTLAQGKPGPTCNLPSRGGKAWTYEGGIRIPTYIAWPKDLKPSICSTPAYTADIYPTILQLCDLPLDPIQHRDGRSLANAIRGTPDAELTDRALAWYYPHDHSSGHRASAAIRRGDWKLIHYLASGNNELYNLSTDPGESHELSSAEPERLASLRDELLRWIEETTR